MHLRVEHSKNMQGLHTIFHAIAGDRAVKEYIATKERCLSVLGRTPQHLSPSDTADNMQVLLAERPRRLKVLELDFLTLHYAFFTIVPLLLAIVFWGVGRNGGEVSFVDSVFFTFSAITEAGLNPVALSNLNTFQQIILWLLIFVGSVPPVTFVLVLVRKRAYDVRYSAALSKIFVEPEGGLHHDHAGSDTTFHEQVRRYSNIPFEASFRLFHEHQALKLLCWLIPVYFIAWQLLGCLGLGKSTNICFWFRKHRKGGNAFVTTRWFQ